MTPLRTSRRKALFGIAILGLLILGGTTYRIVAAGGANGTATSTSNNLRQPVANSNGLIAYYSLDGDAKDYSGNHNDGTLTNFTYDGTTNGWAGGKFGKSLRFTSSLHNYLGVNKDISRSDTTESFWINTTLTSQGIMTYSANSYLNGGYTDRSFFVNADGTLRFYAYSGSGSCGVTGSQISTSKKISDGQWHMVTAAFTTSNKNIYIDGVLDSNDPVGIGTANSMPYFSIGWANALTCYTPSNTFFNGFLDDIRIYNRALSASEIAQLYAGSPSLNCDQTCKIWLKFDDNSGTTAKDSVGTYPGTLNGSTTWTTGNFASAVNLDGSTGYASVPDLGITAGTVDMWINPTSVSGDQRLFAQDSGATTQAGHIALNQLSGENGSLWVFDGSAWQRLSADGTVKAGQWNQVVVSNNGGTVTAYVNGTQQLTATSAFNFSGVAATIGGKFLGTAGGTFNGSVDDFRVYSRMLAPEEVAEQWRLGT